MKNYIEQGKTLKEYIMMIDELLAEGKTTGPDQSESMLNYGKLNRQRMRRLDKTVKLNDSVVEKARSFGRKMIWLVITEGWCGDAAQNMPVIEKIVAESPNIQTRYVLRDENPELMDQYLTNNARSIPRVIMLDAETLEELAVWGPRPQAAMDYFVEMRKSGMEKPVISENIQRWYLKDKEQTVQREFEALLEKLDTKKRVSVLV